MRRLFIIGGILSVVLLALPQMALAHTGTVACNSSGIVFNYNNNFQNDTVVTEFVKDSTQGNGNVYTVTVPAHKAFTHTVPSPSNSVIASASWIDGKSKGSIGPVMFICPSPPVKTPPTPICPTDTVPESMSGGVLVCIRNNTVTINVPGPTPLPITNTVYVNVVKWKTKTVTKIKYRDKWHVKYIQWCKLPPKGVAGVTG